ncbi:cyclin-domain-containing protein [Spinellus fusiger]|nr:cyclin-domain-containing protein [Spinellus fusiger]
MERNGFGLPLHDVQNEWLVPEYYYAVDINYLTHMLADMLNRLIAHNDLIPLTPNTLTRFHSRTSPNITLSDYLCRIVKYTSVEKSCLLILLIYIDRMCDTHPHFTISSLTVHRFLITAVMVSSKALCDSYCTNSHYAKVGGVSTQELNALELEFLSLIDWRLSSSGVVLQQYYANLVRQHPCYERLHTVNTHASLLELPLERKRKRSVGEEPMEKEKVEESGHDNQAQGLEQVAVSEQDPISEQDTLRHFDTLLDTCEISYIA